MWKLIYAIMSGDETRNRIPERLNAEKWILTTQHFIRPGFVTNSFQRKPNDIFLMKMTHSFRAWPLPTQIYRTERNSSQKIWALIACVIIGPPEAYISKNQLWWTTEKDTERAIQASQAVLPWQSNWDLNSWMPIGLYYWANKQQSRAGPKVTLFLRSDWLRDPVQSRWQN